MVHRATDMEAVAKIINHPRVYGWVTDDCSPDEYVPDRDKLYIINEEKTAVIRVDCLNGATCMVHTSAMPGLSGTAEEFVMEAIKWGWDNTNYSKIVSIFPSFNRMADRLCRLCGFKKEGLITKSFLKNYKLYDQFVYGLSKYDKGV
jgi:hypothetical protein